MKWKEHSNGTFLNPSNKVCIINGKNIYFAQIGCKYIARYKEVVTVNGKEFTEDFPSKITETDCSFHSVGSHYVEPVFWRGKFYNLHSLDRINTLDQINDAIGYLNKIDKSCYVSDYWHHWNQECDTNSGENFSKVRLIDGHSRYIHRDVTVSELQMGFTGLSRAAKEFNGDCQRPMNQFIADMCNILQLTEKKYKSGKYNLTDQMIKRLHSKIQHKSQNKYTWYQ